mmetsp:Transcript_37576/g.86833  ORF Transcript_37576/g.86833 Transcript_37576/m.86833 type:complete len:89 (-) Transcript_37576:748-1014(-)
MLPKDVEVVEVEAGDDELDETLDNGAELEVEDDKVTDSVDANPLSEVVLACCVVFVDALLVFSGNDVSSDGSVLLLLLLLFQAIELFS